MEVTARSWRLSSAAGARSWYLALELTTVVCDSAGAAVR